MSTETTQPRVKLGRQTYDVRCLECKDGNSTKNKRQFTQIFEIFGHLNPALNGRKVRFWQSMEPQSEYFVNIQRKALGLPVVPAEGIPVIRDSEYIGKTGKCLISETEKKELDEQGQVLVDPYEGTPLVEITTTIERWFPRPAGK